MSDVLTVIPAKIGSTRLPRKNILPLAGRPLLHYSIESAVKSGVCGEIMVSTDDREVAEVASKGGASVPFIRPAHLGKDPYGVVDVCLNVLDEYEKSGRRFRTLIILLPTSPFRTAHDIREAANVFVEMNASFLMSVSEFGHNPFGALKASPEGERVMVPCFPEYIGKKRHEVPKAFRANGAIHIVDVDSFRRANTYYGKPFFTYEMPWPRDLDIDTEADFRYAEYLLRTGAIDESDAQEY